MTETYYEAICQDRGDVVALIEEINALSPAARDAARVAVWDAEQGPTWDAAHDAALDAARAAMWDIAWEDAWEAVLATAALNAARAAMWDIAWEDAWEAVLATAVRDVINQEHYATLMAPMEAARAVMRSERPQ